MKKAALKILAGVLSVTMALAGCSSSSPTTQESSQKPQETAGSNAGSGGEPTKLTLWSFVPLHLEFYNDALERWNQTHPDKKITLETASYPFEDYHNKLLVSLQSGVGAPDIADIEINKFPNFLKGQPQLVDLTNVVAPEKDKFIQSRLDVYSKDGKIYGLPTHVGATVMYYNKEILNQAGVNPDDIKTWDDYVKAGKQVLEKTGKPMMTVEGAGHWTFLPMISQQGSDYFDKDGNVILDNETNIKTLQFLQDMVYKDKIAFPAPGGAHSKEEYFGFMNQGGAASVLMPFWYMGRFVSYMPDLKGKMIVRPMPSWEEGGNRSAGMGGTGTVVTNQSKNQELATEFLAFAKLSKEANIQIWKKLGFDPPRWDVWESPELKEPNVYTEYFGADLFDQIKVLKDEISPMNYTENSPKARSVVEKKVSYEAIQQNSKSPEQVLKEAAADLRK
ncbi:ABC transporter substrate-binding protein [Ammoniphilus sp. 3BR4]|uniref:ABC transporter substrate-binding protein n=1 Tax=Ammoniphilus sp. 3BR4 TaxID=3158265 RepID=UPI003467925A